MNLKRIIWRSSRAEEFLGILWAIAALLSYQIDESKFLTLVFVVMAIASFVAAMMRATEEAKDEKKRKQYVIIKEEKNRITLRIVENTEDHPDYIEHNGCTYTLEMCNGKDAVFKKKGTQ